MFAAPVVLAPMPVPVLGAMGVGPGVRTPATVSTGVGVAGGRVAVGGTAVAVGGTVVGGTTVGGTAVGGTEVGGTTVGSAKQLLVHVGGGGSLRTLRKFNVVVPPTVTATLVMEIAPAGANAGVSPDLLFGFSDTT